MSALRRSPLKKQSKKRAKANKLYLAKRKAFLALRPLCEVWVALSNWDSERALDMKKEIFNDWRVIYSQDVHHMAGRRGDNFLDETTWMAVSRLGHAWIHSNPSAARKMGWLK